MSGKCRRDSRSRDFCFDSVEVRFFTLETTDFLGGKRVDDAKTVTRRTRLIESLPQVYFKVINISNEWGFL